MNKRPYLSNSQHQQPQSEPATIHSELGPSASTLAGGANLTSMRLDALISVAVPEAFNGCWRGQLGKRSSLYINFGS